MLEIVLSIAVIAGWLFNAITAIQTRRHMWERSETLGAREDRLDELAAELLFYIQRKNEKEFGDD